MPLQYQPKAPLRLRDTEDTLTPRLIALQQAAMARDNQRSAEEARSNVDSIQKSYGAFGNALSSLGGSYADYKDKDAKNQRYAEEMALKKQSLDQQAKMLATTEELKNAQIAQIKNKGGFETWLSNQPPEVQARIYGVQSGIVPKAENEKPQAQRFTPVPGADGIYSFNTATGKPEKTNIPPPVKAPTAADLTSSGKRPLPAGEAQALGEMQSVMKTIDKIEQDWLDKASSRGSSLKQFVPGSDANVYASDKDIAAQSIGVPLEKGKLTDADRAFYLKNIPDPSDTPAQARNKIINLKKFAKGKIEGQLSGFKSSGYDTEGFAPIPETWLSSKIGAAAPPSNTAIAAPSPKPLESLSDEELDAELARLKGK